MVRMDHDASLRKHLLELLDGGSAHLRFDDVIKEWPRHLQGVKPDGAAHSPWQVVEHMRICQWDILEFSHNADHESPDWPDCYWPKEEAPATDEAWTETIEKVRTDLAAMKSLVEDPQCDLHKPFPWGEGQTLLREAMLVADHNAYHLGELMVLRRLLGV